MIASTYAMRLNAYNMYISLLGDSLENETAKEKCKKYNGFQPRQFLLKLIYFHEEDISSEEVQNIKNILGLKNAN